jgi:hypothetical protein
MAMEYSQGTELDVRSNRFIDIEFTVDNVPKELADKTVVISLFKDGNGIQSDVGVLRVARRREYSIIFPDINKVT